MILQMDVGNTRIKWRWLESDSLTVLGRGHGLFKELQLSDGRLPERIELACVCSTAQRRELLAACGERFPGVPCVESRSMAQLGELRNSYAQPGDLGVDRWLAMLEAHYRFPGGVAVVDAGTAVTIDYVAPDGHHLGGYILPGRQLMERALDQGTAQVLFQSHEGGCSAEPGHSTQACVMSGQVWLCRALLKQVMVDAQHQGLQTVVVTGGDARRYIDGTTERLEHCPDLVLDGLSRYCKLIAAGGSNG